MASESAILTWMLALPAAGGGLILALPAAHAKKARGIAMAFLTATLVIAAIGAGWMDWSQGSEPQLTMRFAWLGVLGSAYSIGVDGLSMPLVLLTAAMGMIACWASYGIIRAGRAYFALLLWAVVGLLGAFIAQDLLLFFVFFELSLVPLYFLIGGWGGPRKEYAASKFFLFSMVGALLLLVTLLVVYAQTHGAGPNNAPVWDLTQLVRNPGVRSHINAEAGLSTMAFWLLIVAFGIKMAIVPMHTWLGDALAEAPDSRGHVAGHCRDQSWRLWVDTGLLPHFSEQAAEQWRPMAWLGVFTILYAALAALAQKDLRRVVAFGSIAQMGYVLLGLAVMSQTAIQGVGFLLLAHGVSIGMLVFITGMIVDRTGHCEIKRLGGLAGHMPAFAGWSALGFLTAMGLPGLCVFVGELLILLGTFTTMPKDGPRETVLWLGIIGAGAMLLTGACYIWAFQRIFLGAAKPEHSNVARLSSSEKWILVAFSLATVVLGILPGLLLEPMRGGLIRGCVSVSEITKHQSGCSFLGPFLPESQLVPIKNAFIVLRDR